MRRSSMTKNPFSKENIHRWAVGANEEQRKLMDEVKTMNHLPPEESRILTEKLKSIGREVETERYFATEKTCDNKWDIHTCPSCQEAKSEYFCQFRDCEESVYDKGRFPTYTLSEMLELLPRTVIQQKEVFPGITSLGEGYVVSWITEDSLTWGGQFMSTSPLLATYHALLWAIDEGYVEGKK